MYVLSREICRHKLLSLVIYAMLLPHSVNEMFVSINADAVFVEFIVKVLQSQHK